MDVQRPDKLWCLQPRVLALLGAFLAFFPSGVSLYWGNLSVYVHSYIRHFNEGEKVPGPWIISTYLVCNNLGLLCARMIYKYIGRRPTALVAILLFSCGLFLSSITVNRRLYATCASFGCLAGFGSGLLHSTIICDVIDWSGHRVGFFTQIVTTSYNMGSVLINQCITWYINPQNDDVSITVGPVSYFSKEALLDKVPRTFLLLGAYSLSCQLGGLLLMRSIAHNIPCEEEAEEEEIKGLIEMDCDDNGDANDCITGDNYCNAVSADNTEYYTRKYTSVNSTGPIIDEGFNNSDSINTCLRLGVVSNEESEFLDYSASQNTSVTVEVQHNDKTKCRNHDIGDISVPCVATFNGHINYTRSQNIDGLVPFKSKLSQTLDADSKDQRFKIESKLQSKINANILTSSDIQHVEEKPIKTWYYQEVAPRQLMCTKPAYALLSAILAKHITFLLLSNYYKSFGENYIHDDHFLATLGTMLSLFSITAKPMVGLAIDHFGIRTPSLLSILMLCMTSGMYSFTPGVNKWLYLCSSLLFEWAICAVSTCCSLGTLLILGKKYFTTNYGLLCSLRIVLDIFAPPIVQTILTHYGWVVLFSGASIVVFFSLIINFFLLP